MYALGIHAAYHDCSACPAPTGSAAGGACTAARGVTVAAVMRQVTPWLRGARLHA